MSLAEPTPMVEPIVDFAAGVVYRGSTNVHLEPRALALLRHLVSRPGRLVTKQEVIRDAWGCQSLSDDTVWRAVAQLRTALADDPSSPRWIETIPRRGYRLLRAPRGGNMAGTAPTADVAPPPARRRRRLLAAAGLALVALGAVGATTAYRATHPAPTADERAADDEQLVTTLRHGLYYYEQLTPASFARARDFFVEASALAPDDPRPQALLALAQAQLGDPATALPNARQAAERAPTWATAHWVHGFTLMANGRLTEASAAYAAALALDPNDLATQRRACHVQQARGQLAASIDCFRSVLARAPGHWSPTGYALAFGGLANAYYQLGDVEAATSAALAARRHDPAEGRSVFVLASLRARAGDITGARAILHELDDVHSGEGTFVGLQVGHVWIDDDLPAEVLAAPPTTKPTGLFGPMAAANLRARVASTLAASHPERARTLANELSRELEAHLAAGSEHWADAAYLAASESVLGELDAAIGHLTRAVELGYLYPAELERDPLFERLRQRPGFATIRRHVAERCEAERQQLAASGHVPAVT